MKIRNILCFVIVGCILISIIGQNPYGNQKASMSVDEFLDHKNRIIKSAVSYLESCQRDNGSFDYSASINNTAEVCAVLREYSDADVSTTNTWLESKLGNRNTDSLARTAIALEDDTLIEEIMENQNSDGGLGLTGEYKSDILDSIIALESINALEDSDTTSEEWQLLCYVARKMNSDGGFSYVSSAESDTILSAMALYTVCKYTNDNKLQSNITSNMISKTEDYVSNSFDNSFPRETIEEDLYSALALSESGYIDDPEELIDTLYKIQKSNGSFYNDIHLTSLVVWLLGEMEMDHLVHIYDLKSSNTSSAYYGVDTSISVAYAISYNARLDAEYKIKCSITNGSETIYESDEVSISLSKNSEVKQGTFEDISINQNKDDGLVVKVELLEDGMVIKESTGTISMENQPRAGETNIDDYYVSLDRYYSFVNDPVDITASLRLLYSTNIINSVDIQTTLTRDGVVLSNEVVSEELRPEEEILKRNILEFTPDVSSAGEYVISVKCIYQGEEIAEEAVSYYILDAPGGRKESYDETPTDAEEMESYFDVEWIGPKLSDYVVYAGSGTEISVDAGMLYCSSDDFKGSIRTEIVKDGKMIDSSESLVTIDKEEHNKEFTDLIVFKPDEIGEYTVSVVLLDDKGDEIATGDKILKVVEKQRIDLVLNSTVDNNEKQTVDFSWNDISDSQDIYNYRLFRRYEGEDWTARSIWNEETKVKVLNIYPAYPLLEDWMTTTVDSSENPAGMGMFDIDSVHIDEYNSNPEKYMLEGNRWKYDVIYFGSWGCNNVVNLIGCHSSALTRCHKHTHLSVTRLPLILSRNCSLSLS